MIERLLPYFLFRLSLSVASGLLLCLAFPEIGSIYPLAFLAFVPLLILEEYLANRKKSFGLFLHAYLTFFIYNVGTTYWIYYADPGGAYMAFFANTLLMAIAFWLFHLLKRKLGSTWRLPILLSVWLSFEYLHFNWELSWPWLTLGNVFANQPELVQWYSFTGVLGGSLWILLINGIVTHIAIHGFEKNWLRSKRIWTLSSLVIIPMCISLLMYLGHSTEGVPYKALVIQPNIDPYNTKFTSSDEVQLDSMCTLIDAHFSPKTQLILAPETALFPNGRIDEDALYNKVFYHTVMEKRAKWNNADFLIGASTYRLFDVPTNYTQHFYTDCNCFIENYNSSILFKQTRKPEIVHKSKLVLGVEKIPFSSIFPSMEKLAINLGGGSGTLGTESEPKIMNADGVNFAPVVCYESIYGSFLAQQTKLGAEFIAIITNDGWWRDTPGYKQHFAFARLRAIENDKYVVRSANTGKSGLISNRGDVLIETGWWQKTAFTATIQRNSTKTLYQILGDYIGFFAVVSFLVIVLMRFYLSFNLKRKSA